MPFIPSPLPEMASAFDAPNFRDWGASSAVSAQSAGVGESGEQGGSLRPWDPEDGGGGSREKKEHDRRTLEITRTEKRASVSAPLRYHSVAVMERMPAYIMRCETFEGRAVVAAVDGRRTEGEGGNERS